MASTDQTTAWRPMSEAPRKGETRILLALPKARWPVVGFWSDWIGWWTNGAVDHMHDHVPLPQPLAWMPCPEMPHA